jgi:hypothetical protein
MSKPLAEDSYRNGGGRGLYAPPDPSRITAVVGLRSPWQAFASGDTATFLVPLSEESCRYLNLDIPRIRHWATTEERSKAGVNPDSIEACYSTLSYH